MKVVFLSVNASWTHTCLAHYYLRNAIADLDHEMQFIELTLKNSCGEALEMIVAAQPDVICLSVYIWNVSFLQQLLPELRKLLPLVKIIAGGPEITYNDTVCLALRPDHAIKGYGEKAFRELALADFTDERDVIMGESAPLAEIPFPYLPGDKDQVKGRMIYYEASRGCACRCSYCLSALDNTLDHLPVERVLQDISKLLLLEPKVIKFIDRSFNQDKAWARAIWKFVISLETGVPFHFELHPDWLEEQDITLLASAPKGRIQFEIGVQSMHAATLEKIDRPSDWSVVQANLEALRLRTVIPLHVDLIAGLPGETLPQIRESVDAVLRTLPTELQLGILKILPGTPLAETAEKDGFLWTEQPPYIILQTDKLAFTEIRHLERIAQVISQYWNKGDFQTVWAKAILWRAPHLCLEQLLALNLAADGQLHSIDRVKRFEIIARWLEQSWSGEERQYLFDALQWDWCRKASEAWYPPALQGSPATEFRKQHYNEIIDWLKSEYWEHVDWNIKRCIVFSATSDVFSREYLEGYTKAVFVSVRDADNAVVIYKRSY